MNNRRYLVFSLVVATAAYFFLVNFLIQFTNARADKILSGAFYFTQFVYRPEPLEIPLYFLGFLIVPFMALGLSHILKKINLEHWSVYIGLGILAILAFKIIVHIFWFDYWKILEQRGDLKIQMLAALSILVFIWVYLRNLSVRPLPFSLPISWGGKTLRYGVFLVLIIMLFTPNFTFDHFHYDYFLSTVNDLHHGKSLLYDTTNQYGLLQTYFLNFLLYLSPVFSYQALSLIFFLIIIFWLTGWYYILRYLLKSEWLAAVATLVSVILYVIPWPDLNLIYNAPGNGPYRHVAFLVLLWVWIRYIPSYSSPYIRGGRKGIKGEMKGGDKREWVMLLATALGFFWFVDNGIFLVLTTLVAFFYLNPKKSVVLAGKLIALILIFAGAFSLVGYLNHGTWPQWQLLYETAKLFQKGFILYPLPSHGMYYFYFLIYLGTIWYIWQQRKTESKQNYVLPLILAVYGAFQLTYYISRSYTENLAPRNGFFLIALIAWWITEIWRRESFQEYRRLVSAFLVASFVFILVFGGYVVLNTFPKRDYLSLKENFFHERLLDGDIFVGTQKTVLEDIEYLKNNYALVKEPAILHWMDVKILMDLGKTNFFGPYDIDLVYYHFQMDKFVNQVLVEKPKYIFIGRPEVPEFEPFGLGKDKYEYFSEKVLDLYSLQKQLNTLNIYRIK